MRRETGSVSDQVLHRMSEGCVTLFRAHSRVCGDGGEEARGRSVVSHHVEVSLVGESPGPDWLVYCQLYSEKAETWVSERWSSSSSSTQQRTVFTEVGGGEAASDLHLVVSVYRLGRIVTQPGEAGHRRSHSGLKSLTVTDHQPPQTQHKRPVAVGVSSLAPLLSGARPSPEHEMTDTIKLFTCEEKEFHQLHSMIIKANGKISPLTAGLANLTLKIRVFTGFLADVRDQNLDLRNLTETRKLGCVRKRNNNFERDLISNERKL